MNKIPMVLAALCLFACSEPHDRIVFSAVQDFHKYQALHGNVAVVFTSEQGPWGRAGAVYGKNQILVVDTAWLASADRPEIYTVIGHELGHLLVQGKGRENELVCDCLSGGFVQTALSDSDASSAVDYLASLGDFGVKGPDHHGTPEERRAATARGRFLARTYGHVDMTRLCKEVVR